MNHMLFFTMLIPVCVYLSYLNWKQHSYYPPVVPPRSNILISHFSSSLEPTQFLPLPQAMNQWPTVVHVSTGVRAYTVLPSPQARNQCSPWLQQAIKQEHPKHISCDKLFCNSAFHVLQTPV